MTSRIQTGFLETCYNWFFLIPFHNHNCKDSLITADQLKEIMDMSHMKNMRETLVKKLADGLGECMRWPKAETLTFYVLLVAALLQELEHIDHPESVLHQSFP